MRRLRMYLPDVPVHVVQRGHNRAACFFRDEDFFIYRTALARAARRYAVAVNAYVLMTNHVHLLVTPADATGISNMMSLLGKIYVTYINRAHGRTGTLWEGRHKASLIGGDDYLLRCMRYIELNPVRAGMVPSPLDYFWSSYGHHVGNCHDPIITEHIVYLGLGVKPAQRRAAYAELVRQGLVRDDVERIRSAIHFNYPFGDDEFYHAVKARVSREIGYAQLGRPSPKSTGA
ncbi:MAG: transposase [Gammaproteobacteria bacterium]|nr:transposase [Gammaproteobacteria bacterium]